MAEKDEKEKAPKAQAQKSEPSPYMVNGHEYDPDTGKYLDGPHPEPETKEEK